MNGCPGLIRRAINAPASICLVCARYGLPGDLVPPAALADSRVWRCVNLGRVG